MRRLGVEPRPSAHADQKHALRSWKAEIIPLDHRRNTDKQHALV